MCSTLQAALQSMTVVHGRAGNSGGVLLDSRGRLIGINTAIASPSGASNGVGFAIPIDAVKGLVDQVALHSVHSALQSEPSGPFITCFCCWGLSAGRLCCSAGLIRTV